MSGIKNLKRIALDSNFFIYHFESNPEFVKHIAPIFEALQKDGLEAVTSVVSIIEALSYPSPPEVIAGIKEGFATMSHLSIINLNPEIAVEAAAIRREYGFKLPDAVQLATAISFKAKAFFTNDHRLRSFKKLKIISLSDLA